MLTAEQVREEAGWEFSPKTNEMLHSYAALLEAMEWFRAGCDGDSFAVKMIRQRAEEILRRKG